MFLAAEDYNFSFRGCNRDLVAKYNGKWLVIFSG